MIVDRKKLDLALARTCKNLRDLKGPVCSDTLVRLYNEREVKPKIVGRVAQALGCDPADIIKED